MRIRTMAKAILADGIFATYTQQINSGAIGTYAETKRTYAEALDEGKIYTYADGINSGKILPYDQALEV